MVHFIFNLFKFCENIDNIISLEKKKNFHFIGYIYGAKYFLNFWDNVIDLRGSALSFFLFTKKEQFIKMKFIVNCTKLKSISSLVSKKNFSPNININFEKNRIQNPKILNYLIVIIKILF